MSGLSEAVARAEKRLADMTQEDRERHCVRILREELNRRADPRSKGEGE